MVTKKFKIIIHVTVDVLTSQIPTILNKKLVPT